MNAKERKRDYDKARRAANPGANAKRCAAWAAKNPEKKTAIDKAWREANPEKKVAGASAFYEKNKDKFRAIDLMRNYGVTVEWYDSMLEKQRGVCAICGGVNSNGKRLCVDHDHITGATRKLLCMPCNLMLGNSSEDATRLRRAADYIEEHKLDRTH